jgi:hypothetical protein
MFINALRIGFECFFFACIYGCGWGNAEILGVGSVMAYDSDERALFKVK